MLDSGGGYDNPLQYSCLENPCGQRSLEGYSPWSLRELDTTERLSTAQHVPDTVCVCIIVHKVSLICVPILQMRIKRLKEN